MKCLCEVAVLSNPFWGFVGRTLVTMLMLHIDITEVLSCKLLSEAYVRSVAIGLRLRGIPNVSVLHNVIAVVSLEF